MSEYGIRDKCHVNTNRDADTFVGIICDKGDFSVHFPLGFHVSEDDRNLRKDIMLLISAIETTIGHRESGIQKSAEEDRKSTRLNSSHSRASRMPSSA